MRVGFLVGTKAGWASWKRTWQAFDTEVLYIGRLALSNQDIIIWIIIISEIALVNAGNHW